MSLPMKTFQSCLVLPLSSYRSCPVGTNIFFIKNAKAVFGSQPANHPQLMETSPGMKLTTLLHLVLRLWRTGAILSIPPNACMACTETGCCLVTVASMSGQIFFATSCLSLPHIYVCLPHWLPSNKATLLKVICPTLPNITYSFLL
jgi:hypothetical protein